MKLLFATATALSLFFTGIVGLHSTPKPTVASLHAFEEPLVAIGGNRSSNQDSVLITALQTYQKRKSYDDVSAITKYLDANPQSPWKFSLLANLGIVYRKTGFFSRAVDVWEQAWALGKGEKKDVEVQALANYVAADLASLLSSLGRTERLESLLAETKGRTIYGSAGNMLMISNENLWLMKNKPGKSFKCGPYALDSIRTFANKKNAHDDLIRQAQSSTKGFSLTQVRDLSNQLKMNYQMAKRQPGSDFIVPSVAHWKSGHYAALLKKQGNFYLTKDPTFGQESLVSSQALEDESSGYYLVPSGSLPSGWQTVSDAEGAKVWGRGVASTLDPVALKPHDKKCPCAGGGSSHGMAVYSIFAMLVSLSIEDTPVGYTPPVGPDLHFTITYNQLEDDQPYFTFSNFGPCWNCSWISYVLIPGYGGGAASSAYLNIRGGGQEIYTPTTGTPVTDSRSYTNYWATQTQGQATLWVSSTHTTYERRMPDGSKEVFSQPNTAVSPSYMFLTAITDPQANSVTLGYDTTSSWYTSFGYLRLTTVTDALGLQTNLTYGLSGYPLIVTQITDPYNRSATFNYAGSSPDQLTSIQDEIGITSTFNYGTGSAITSMVTPYGTTQFSFSDTSYVRSLTVTEPDESEVYTESRLDGSNYPYSDSDSSGCVPSGYGLSVENGELEYQNTYYWDKKAMEVTSDNPERDYTKAHIYHWLIMGTEVSSPILQCEKPALESRIWYNYPGQIYDFYIGTSDQPTVVARVVDRSGTTQAWQYQYNDTHNPAALSVVIDPTGRQTNYTYDSTAGIDLIGVTQTTASGTDTLATITYDNSTYPPHCPYQITDAAGEMTTYAYNSQGQVTSITPPTRSGHSTEATTYGYTSNFLTSITGPVSGAVTTLTYDTGNIYSLMMPRIKTIADAELYTLTYSYDALDRVTSIGYPDSTTETFSYVNPATNAYSVANAVDLDLHSSTDRLTRTTTRTYDWTRHLLSITDPLSRETQYGWCSCGSMTSLTDPKGNVTYFNRDAESRLTSKVYSGETQPPTSPDYTYDIAGRLATATDKRGNVATYSYNLDNRVSRISYSLVSGTVAPPTLSYCYDTYYPRLKSAGTYGQTSYVALAYVSAGSLGAGQVYTVSNNLNSTSPSATTTYTYDEWGRKVGSNIDSSNSQSVVLDSLGRVTNVLNLLAPTTPGFAISYYDPTHPTNRIGGISYPNGQSTSYTYFNSYGSFTATGDENLSEIKNLNPSSTVLSQNDYTVDALGKIITWKQQADSSTPLLWTEGYDTADQLTSAVQTNTAITSPAVVSDSYGYDLAGNMTSSGLSGVSRSPSYNALNQLTGSTPSGSQTVNFTGSLNVAATVTVNGSAATVNSGHDFSGSTSLTSGSTNTVAVVALDAQGNSRTNHYQTIVPVQLSYSPTYDNDGNEQTNGAGQNYTWDAKNELASIVYTAGSNSGNHTEFTYDALGHRIGIVERTGTTVGAGTVTSAKQLVWDGSTLAEERNVSNTVTKRFYPQGEQISGTSYYYTRDHLGSVREMTDGSGTIVARYDYDPYGRTTLVSGSNLSDFQYAGYYTHATSGLNLTLFRAYDPNTARWLARDPAGETERSDGHGGTIGGLNLYGYVRNDPIDYIDPWGLGHGSGLLPNGRPPPGVNDGSQAVETNIALTLLAPLTLPVAAEAGVGTEIALAIQYPIRGGAYAAITATLAALLHEILETSDAPPSSCPNGNMSSPPPPPMQPDAPYPGEEIEP